MSLALPYIEAARFYPEVPRLFVENQKAESPSYESVIYRVTPRATSADVDRILAFVGSKTRPAADTAEALNRVVDSAVYPSAQSLLELKSTGVNLPEAAALLHFFRPAWPLYRPGAVKALAEMGFAVAWREDLTEEGVGAYEGYMAAVDLLKARIPFTYVPESNCFLSRLIEGALNRRGRAEPGGAQNEKA